MALSLGSSHTKESLNLTPGKLSPPRGRELYGSPVGGSHLLSYNYRKHITPWRCTMVLSQEDIMVIYGCHGNKIIMQGTDWETWESEGWMSWFFLERMKNKPLKLMSVNSPQALRFRGLGLPVEEHIKLNFSSRNEAVHCIDLGNVGASPEKRFTRFKIKAWHPQEMEELTRLEGDCAGVREMRPVAKSVWELFVAEGLMVMTSCMCVHS